MKQYLLFVFSLLAVLYCATTATAQQCDGDRYLNQTFTSVHQTPNIIYSTANGTSLRMDIYEPENDQASNRPLIILAHGGSFIGGDENVSDIVNFSTRFAKHGYVVAAIQYRLATVTDLIDSLLMIREVVYAVQDMKAAIRYFHNDAANANIYRVDTNKVFVGGASAGAILAVHLGYLTNLEELPSYISTVIETNGGLEGNSGWPGYGTQAAGIINFCGGINKAEWIDAGDLPIVSVHGTADSTVPYAHGEVLGSGAGSIFDLVTIDGSGVIHQRADEVGIYNDLWTLPGEEHMAHATSAHVDESESFVMEFLYPLVCGTASVDAVRSNINVAVAPNPNTGQFTLYLPQSDAQVPYSVRIFDAMGRLVKQYEEVRGQSPSFNANLQDGMYLLQISSERGVGTKSFIVNSY